MGGGKIPVLEPQCLVEVTFQTKFDPKFDRSLQINSDNKDFFTATDCLEIFNLSGVREKKRGSLCRQGSPYLPQGTIINSSEKREERNATQNERLPEVLGEYQAISSPETKIKTAAKYLKSSVNDCICTETLAQSQETTL